MMRDMTGVFNLGRRKENKSGTGGSNKWRL